VIALRGRLSKSKEACQIGIFEQDLPLQFNTQSGHTLRSVFGPQPNDRLRTDLLLTLTERRSVNASNIKSFYSDAVWLSVIDDSHR